MPACEWCDGEGDTERGDCAGCAGSGIEPDDGEFVDESDVLCADCWREDRLLATRDWSSM